ncbi:3-phosphoshikimate 1-carboxyvinyltransferase [Haloferax mediterranei ATCC 33500]|uniref:3-phosphoshikimate 1-carboxyvinyltransferase n=1 Tax=Haloferax mediterranei (strain ATCC 33500 / DSM 1411 / JCM 8866 / NBRC 14739 / NCIMB 2177 / R-4) TaxID=523841 RepID=I3R4C5_HALMT|nr:3-phosphoshikimate 1-carboxyvinyltransferase [Haloferax mediterranei]AFK19085.1 3-phosphoshikimate 1-carboxyvinyltransferase [Haloferax mediterranei ATCC 33500]AHZ21554.1 3-phosphoshikimate 1-carboxyvinyltransferase [Haloferax mediterranei ATCC 33500]EMA04016.1 3-phosphoshikimate 1-carboxyvinyltransferase [Haloferax mediterranei ATCC 33500]MDX5989178.1 3-phosphoshikimate 1-carboxyvinyltransferase [Haloferax mediterranei ATCC 33500]QCQ75559.1 3-phosphoshikimate 1-carboxyvinyltransferase [Hal
MDAHVSPSRVSGRIRAPPSKSYTHRAILAAGYSDEAVVRDALVSADTKATMRAVRAFGGTVDRDGQTVDVVGFDGRPGTPDDVIDCANSGTTMRLVTGCAALGADLTVLTGDESLRSRPHGPLLTAVFDLDGRAESTRRNGQAPLVVGDGMTGGTVEIPGDVSSQFITALLMAGAVTDVGIDIDLTTELKSSPYVDITLELLSDFGVEATRTEDGFSVPGGQSYHPVDGEYSVPGDFSSISYLLAAGAVAGAEGTSVTIEGARPSAQGDSAIVDIVRDMGAEVEWDEDAGELTVSPADLTGTTVDVGDTPDLLPTIAVLGAIADGDTVIENCEHVRYKETDRVTAMAEELAKMGANVTEQQDRLTIHGGETDLVGAAVDGRGDHRIVMSLTIAALVAKGETTIAGSEHVDVSFPNFFETMRDLGVDVLEN